MNIPFFSCILLLTYSLTPKGVSKRVSDSDLRVATLVSYAVCLGFRNFMGLAVVGIPLTFTALLIKLFLFIREPLRSKRNKTFA